MTETNKNSQRRRADLRSRYVINWWESDGKMEMSALKIWRQLKYLLCNKCPNEICMPVHWNARLIQRITNQRQITVAISICSRFKIDRCKYFMLISYLALIIRLAYSPRLFTTAWLKMVLLLRVIEFTKCSLFFCLSLFSMNWWHGLWTMLTHPPKNEKNPFLNRGTRESNDMTWWFLFNFESGMSWIFR